MGIVLVCFTVMQFVPGGPVELAVQALRGQHASEGGGGGGASARNILRPEQIEDLKKLYGFDQPLDQRLFNTVKSLFTFNFGDSFNYRAHPRKASRVVDVRYSQSILNLFAVYSSWYRQSQAPVEPL